MALGYQNSFYLKQAQQKQQSLYNGKVLLKKHDPPAAYDSEETSPENETIEQRNTLNLQTEIDRTKDKLKTCIITKEKEYVVLWNNWYKKCEECKYDNISYEKAYKDMQQKIERLQAQLGDLKGISKDTPCVSNTLDPLSRKLEDENGELEFQVLNYAKEMHTLRPHTRTCLTLSM
ncbi:hypothetical protein Tco_0562325 [Tanacetum coccineum]